MTVKISGIELLKKRILSVPDKAKKTSTNLLKQRTWKVFDELVLNTPQWSGATAASWVVEIKTYPASKYQYSAAEARLRTGGVGAFWKNQKPIRNLGSHETYQVANSFNAERIGSIRYNSKISIVNVSPIADELATDPEFELRPGNFLPGDYLAIKHTVTKFKNLRSDIV